MIRRPLLVLPLLLALAACNGAGQTAAGGGPAVSRPGPGDEQQAMTTPRPGPGGLAPSALKGMSAAAAEYALGKPVFIRRDPPAEIWQYRVKACTLDLFLYDEKGRRSVAHYAVRTPGGAAVSDSACLDEVLARRDGIPVS